MKDGEPREKALPIGPEHINLQPGNKGYLIMVKDIYDLTEGENDSQKVADQLAELAQRARKTIESQGGVFNGLIQIRSYEKVPGHRGDGYQLKTFALAHKKFRIDYLSS